VKLTVKMEKNADSRGGLYISRVYPKDDAPVFETFLTSEIGQHGSSIHARATQLQEPPGSRTLNMATHLPNEMPHN